MASHGKGGGKGCSRTIVAVTAAATNGAIGTHRSYATSPFSSFPFRADARRCCAEHAVLERDELSVPRHDSYTTAVFENVAGMVRMRAVNARGDSV